MELIEIEGEGLVIIVSVEIVTILCSYLESVGVIMD